MDNRVNSRINLGGEWNVAESGGSVGVRNVWPLDLRITDSVFTGSYGEIGGGLSMRWGEPLHGDHVDGSTTVLVRRTVFDTNRATRKGGAVAATFSPKSTNEATGSFNLTFDDCTPAGNRATAYARCHSVSAY